MMEQVRDMGILWGIVIHERHDNDVLVCHRGNDAEL
jgi:hypothetical protein